MIEDPLDRMIHDLRNSLGSIILNLEVATDPALSSGLALESAVDALAEARRMKDGLSAIRALMEPGS